MSRSWWKQGGLGLCLLGAALGAQALDVDTFATNQSALSLTFPPAGTSASSSASGGGILGGERDLQLSLTAGVIAGNTSSATVSSGFLSYSQDATIVANTTLQWDGADGSAALNASGLGGLDLTESGSRDAFALDIVFDDLPVPIVLTVYSGAGNASSFTLNSPGLLFSNTRYVIPFSAFTTSLGGGANFASVGAITLNAGSTTTAPDLVIDAFGTVALVDGSKTASLQNDVNSNSTIDAGDTVRYTITLSNPDDTFNASAVGLSLSDSPDANTALVVGSVTASQGTVTSGNGAGQTSVAVNVGTIPDAASVSITFDVVVSPTLPIAITQISNQGRFSSASLNLVGTDNPATGTAGDATVSTVVGVNPVAFSIAPASIVEGTGGSQSLVFTVTATPAPSAATTVNYATSNGTAIAGVDYTSANGTLNFASGTATQTFSVALTTDSTVEGNETLTATLSAATAGATISTASATGTLTNDDSAVLSLSAPAVAEGNAGTTPLPFVLSLSNPVQGAVSVSYASADGNNGNALLNATIADNDYQAATGTVSFPSDSSANQSVNVTINGDTDVEPNQGLRLNLSNLVVPATLNPGSVTLAAAVGNGTINNDDGTVVSVANASLTEGDAGTSNMSFTVSLSNPNKDPVTVNYATSDGTATAGSDYTVASGTLTFPGNSQSQTVNVVVSGELLVEANETLTLTLSNASGAILGAAVATGTINNNDSATLSLNSPAAIAEGNAGNTPLSFTATLSNPVQGVVSATLNTADGNNGNALLNATVADNDYVAVSNGTLTINTGLTASSAVQIVGDTDVEPNQSFRLILSNLVVPVGIPAGAVTLATATGTGTINNDDNTALSIANAALVEGNAGTSTLSFTVSLSAPNKDPVTVSYATSNGTAMAGSDYVATSGSLNFPGNSLSQTIAVTINGDVQLENSETFTLTLSAPVGASLATASATGTITDDDAVSLSVAGASASEGSGISGQGQLSFVVSLTGSSAVPVSVQYATSAGTATAADFTAVSGSLTFAPGESSKTVLVTVIPDAIPEGPETLSFTLSNPNPAPPQVTLGNASATGTILDDDFVSQIPANDGRALLLLLLALATIGAVLTRRR